MVSRGSGITFVLALASVQPLLHIGEADGELWNLGTDSELWKWDHTCC